MKVRLYQKGITGKRKWIYGAALFAIEKRLHHENESKWYMIHSAGFCIIDVAIECQEASFLVQK